MLAGFFGVSVERRISTLQTQPFPFVRPALVIITCQVDVANIVYRFTYFGLYFAKAKFVGTRSYSLFVGYFRQLWAMTSHVDCLSKLWNLLYVFGVSSKDCFCCVIRQMECAPCWKHSTYIQLYDTLYNGLFVSIFIQVAKL